MIEPYNQRISVRLSTSQFQALKHMSEQRKTSAPELIRKAVEYMLDSEYRPPA